MLKLLGALLVMGGALWWGLSAVGQLRRRVRVLEELRTSLVWLGEELTFRLTPLQRLLERLAREKPDPVGQFFQDALEGLRRDPEAGLYPSWRRAMVGWLDGLKEEERQALLEAGQTLGRYDAKTQSQALARSARRLDAARAQAEEEARRLGRVYTALSVAAGAAAVLVLA